MIEHIHKRVYFGWWVLLKSNWNFIKEELFLLIYFPPRNLIQISLFGKIIDIHA